MMIVLFQSQKFALLKKYISAIRHFAILIPNILIVFVSF